jgi:hypothetical protein
MEIDRGRQRYKSMQENDRGAEGGVRISTFKEDESRDTFESIM